MLEDSPAPSGQGLVSQPITSGGFCTGGEDRAGVKAGAFALFHFIGVDGDTQARQVIPVDRLVQMLTDVPLDQCYAFVVVQLGVSRHEGTIA